MNETATASSVSTKPTLRLKPRLGLGIGTFTFFGDVGGDTKSYSPLSSNFGYHIRLSNEISPYFDVSLQAVFGKFVVNEINTDRRYNFMSEIRTGGLNISYNFGNFLKEDRFIEPWVSVGIESIEHLSKTDLYDAEGNMYHYWSDGSIRNMAENSGNASDAIMLQRDYTYETDLRELNADGIGKYQERTWAIPVGAGVNLRMTDRFRTRIGATMHYSFSDLIDNVSSAGEGTRKGNSNNDKFLYASIALNYDLSITPKNQPVPFEFFDENGDLITMDLGDWDKDGVGDLEDKCPGTPEGAKVDAFGCPVDSDGDGFPDYRDAEPASYAGAIVNPAGEFMTDDQIEQRYLAWTDSISWISYAGAGSFTEDFASLNHDPKKRPNDPSYTVQIGVSDDGLTQAEINAILSLKDVKSVKRGEESMYVVGAFDKLPDAVQRKIELDQKGIAGAVRYDDGNQMKNVDQEAFAVETELREGSEEMALENSEVVYRVQLGAFKYHLSKNIFTGINDVVAIKGDDGLTRYSTGAFDSPQAAATHKANMLLEGFEGAFITSYQSGKRITLAEAGMNVAKDVDDLTYDIASGGVKKELIRFRIQLGAFEGNIPTDVLDAFLELGKVRPQRDTDDITKYLHGDFDSLEDAEKALIRVQDEGLPGAFVIGDFNGKLIPADQAKKLQTGEDDEVFFPQD